MSVVATKDWHRLKDGSAQCDLSAGVQVARRAVRCVFRACVRAMRFSVDPAQKKPLNHFLPGRPGWSRRPPRWLAWSGCVLARRRQADPAALGYPVTAFITLEIRQADGQIRVADRLAAIPGSGPRWESWSRRLS